MTLLVLSGIAVLLSLFGVRPFPFDMAWVAILLCGVPIILEAAIGLITAFDIKADLLVSLALIASVAIGEDFAAGEVAFIMQLGALLEEITVARARAGIEKLVQPHAPDRPCAPRRPGDGPPRGTGAGGGCPPGAARGDRPRGRGDHRGPNLHRPGGDDRRIPAGGQGPRG